MTTFNGPRAGVEDIPQAADQNSPWRTVQKACAWSIVGLAVPFFVGFIIAGFLPPPSPTLSAEQIADFFRSHLTAIRFGLVFVALGVGLVGPFFGLMTVQMLRMGRRCAPLAYAQLALGGVATLEVINPIMTLEAAAFRPDRDPKLIQLLNDLGWIPFVAVTDTFIVQVGCIAVATLLDRRPEPIFPRWYGYLSILMCSVCIPGEFLVFFRTGPLAWNGLLSWWNFVVIFGAWMACSAYVLLRAVKRDDNEPLPGSGGSDIQRQLEEVRAELDSIRATHTQ